MKKISLALITITIVTAFTGCNIYGTDGSLAISTDPASSDTLESIESSTESGESEESLMEVVVIDDPTIPLEASKESKEDLREMLLDMAYANNSNLGIGFRLKDVQASLSVSQIRPVVPDEYIIYEGIEFYSIHDCIEGGRLYVFYSPYWGSHGYPSEGSHDEGEFLYSVDDYYVLWGVFVEKNLRDQDFNGLEIGVSTIKDVELIDSATSFNFVNEDDDIDGFMLDRLNYMDFSYYSIHFTSEGGMYFGYAKVGEEFVLSYIDDALDYTDTAMSFAVVEDVDRLP